jgi:hypothetical protein
MGDKKTIIQNKFRHRNIIYHTSRDINGEGHSLYSIYIYGRNKTSLLYWQTYKIIREYCGDINFIPIRNEFNNGTLFTQEELKIIFNMEQEYPTIDNYNLDSLFH